MFVPVTVPLCAGPARCPSGRAPSHPCPWRPPPLSPGLHRTPRSVAFTSRYHTVPSSIILCWSGLVQPRADHARFCCFSSSSRVMCVEEQQHQHCGCIDSAGQPRLKRTPTNTPRSLEQGASTGKDPLTWAKHETSLLYVLWLESYPISVAVWKLTKDLFVPLLPPANEVAGR